MYLFRKVKGRKNASAFPAGSVYGYQCRTADPEESGLMEMFIEGTLRLLNSLVFYKAIYFC